MIEEKGTLPMGIDYKGAVQKDFILAPQLVKDSIDAIEDERAQRNDSYLGVCLLAKQIKKLGGIPKDEITPDLLMELTEVDFKELMEVKETLEKRLNSFRSSEEKPKKAGIGIT